MLGRTSAAQPIAGRLGRTTFAAVTAVALLLGAAACGTDDAGSGSGSTDGGSSAAPSGGADTPQAAYQAFVQAVTDDDEPAFEAAVLPKFWSDIYDGEKTLSGFLEKHHAAVESGQLELPSTPDQLVVGAARLGVDDDTLSEMADGLGLDDIEDDDLAGAIVTDGYDPDSDPSTKDSQDLRIALIRDGDRWFVSGTEQAS